MNKIELKMMKGMVSILNEASKAYHNQNPIMTDEQFAIRDNDLVIFESETGVVLLNSPHCTVDMQSIVDTLEIKNDRFKEYQDIKDIIEFSNQKELVAYIDVDGSDAIITYVNGRIDNIQVDNTNKDILNIICNLSIPYCISENINCSVKGKIAILDNPVFYATEIIQGGDNAFKNNLNRAKDLCFDVVPNWSFTTLNPKSFQSSIEYIFECAEEDGIPCNGIVFKLNDIEYSKMLSVMSCDAYDGITYKLNYNN